MDAFFGSGAPMWAAPAMGAVGVGYQMPMMAGTPALGTPGFNSPVASMGTPETAQAFARTPMSPSIAVPATPTMGMTTLATTIGVTPASLLALVAMRRGQPQGPVNDQEVEEFLYDMFELLPGTSDVDVRCENGRATVSGSVHHKRLKRDLGELAWAIPVVTDVQNNVTITPRRRARANAAR
jgi:hypothetical protein